MRTESNAVGADSMVTDRRVMPGALITPLVHGECCGRSISFRERPKRVSPKEIRSLQTVFQEEGQNEAIC